MTKRPLTIVPAEVRTLVGCPQLDDVIPHTTHPRWATYEEWVHALLVFYINRGLRDLSMQEQG